MASMQIAAMKLAKEQATGNAAVTKAQDALTAAQLRAAGASGKQLPVALNAVHAAQLKLTVAQENAAKLNHTTVPEAFERTVESIKHAHNETQALAEASSIFGSRGGVQLVDAIRQGKFSVDALGVSLRSSHDDIAKTAERTQTLGAAMGHLRNASEVALQPLASGVWKDINNILISITNSLTPFVNMLAADLPTAMQSLKPYFDILLANLRLTFQIISDLARVVAPLVKVAFDLIGVVLDIFTGKWGKAWQSFTAAWRAAIQALEAVPRLLIDLVEKPFIEIGAVVDLALGGFIARVQRIPSDILNALSSLGSTVITLFSAAWTGLDTVANTAMSAFWSWVTSIPTTVVNDLAALGAHIFGAISSGFSQAVQGAVAGIAGLWGWVSSIPTQVVNGLVALGTDIFLAVASGFSQALSGAGAGITSLISWLGTLPGQLITAMGDIGVQMFNEGVKIIQKLADGITSAIGAVGSAMGSVASKVLGFIGLSPAKEGPLSGQGDFILRGKMLADRLAMGLAQGQADVSAAMNVLLSGAGGTGAPVAGGGLAFGGARNAPAVVIHNAHFSSEVDVEAFMKKAGWVVATQQA
jgi:hypothetical protein